MYGVTITELINKMNLKNILPEIDTDKVVLSHPDVNRPALQLQVSSIILIGKEYRLLVLWSRSILRLCPGTGRLPCMKDCYPAKFPVCSTAAPRCLMKI